jgi:hypothetical protein
MQCRYIAVVLAIVFGAIPVHAQATGKKKVGGTVNATTRIGSPVIVKKFADPATKQAGDTFGIVNVNDIYLVIQCAK